MFKNAWEEYKAKNGSTPFDLINPQNYVSENISQERMKICNDCDYLIKVTNQCRQCGCFMNLKTKLVNSKCPVGKW